MSELIKGYHDGFKYFQILFMTNNWHIDTIQSTLPTLVLQLNNPSSYKEVRIFIMARSPKITLIY
jgi:hypothetical protein